MHVRMSDKLRVQLAKAGNPHAAASGFQESGRHAAGAMVSTKGGEASDEIGARGSAEVEPGNEDGGAGARAGDQVRHRANVGVAGSTAMGRRPGSRAAARGPVVKLE